MTTFDPHSLLAPYSLDALEEQERQSFEAHLERCPTCQAELPGFWATAAQLGSADESAPPAGLRSRILAEVAATPQERSVVTAIGRRSRIGRALPTMAAAASVLVAALAVGGYVMERQEAQDLRADNERVSAIVAAEDAQISTGTVSTGGSVRMIASPSHDAAVFVGTSLRDLDDDRVYQLWAMHDGKPVSAGVLGASSGMLYVPSIEGADGFAVTVEPDGGSDQPTSEPIVSMPA